MGKALDFLLPWDSQPQEAAGVDWENPLASKLLSQVGPGIYDPVTGGLCSLTGGPSISATSMGRALTFNGTTQYASWKYPYSGNPNNFSVAGWIKATTTNNRAFCGRYETTTNNRSWFMGVANTPWVGAPSGNEFSVVVSTDGGVTNIKAYYTTGISVADDSWHHVAFTFSGGTLLLYVDGVARTTTKNSDAAFTTIYGGTADLSLGAINPSTGGASFSNGSNLGFSVFERALSGAEIAALRSNTWQLSAPRAIWVPVSAGGGSTAAITQADGVATTSTLAATSTAATAITQAAGTATASTLAASSVAAAAFTQADGAATASALASTSTAVAAITPADGVGTASTLAASSTAVTALAQADGAATPSTLAGSSTAAAAITQADGVATTSTLAGAAGSASITPADGAATTSTMAGTSTAVSAFAQADGAATASSLPGTSTAVAAITPAAGDATAATMASDSGTIVSATMSPASGTATASAFAASAFAASVCIAAAGAASAQTMAATSQAVAAISAAAGVATCSTLVDANGVDTNSAWWTYTVEADNLTFTVAADDLTYTIGV